MIKQTIETLIEGQDLSQETAQRAMEFIMTGEATPAQLAAFLTALRMKGETVDEITGFARAMRKAAIPVNVDGPVIDTCGTGGDGSGSYNISTASAIVAAAAGIRVAKHGNRSASSKCGSADVLEALGVRIAVTPEQAQQCLEKVGIAFLFAQAFHPAMRHVAPVRSELGIRTVFNILGPLANPARATRQVLGVASAELAPKMAGILQQLGVEKALVVHGADGLDEISLSGPTLVYEVDGDEIRQYAVSPEELGLPMADRSTLAGGDKETNAEILRALFRGETGPKRDALLANAAAALYVGGKTTSLIDGVRAAAEVIDSGAALRKLDEFVAFTQALDG
ncbi:MAG: anthranilate phosphoribosyltransferase [Chloroflexi bacterium]|nr:anthranilate phosphoribosyltransferase [Chloroflexota bacterium]